MYIVLLGGKLLKEFDRWDIRSVARAEAWIREHGMVICRCECLGSGACVLTVRSR